MATPIQIVIDTHDPAALADFWATALGYVLQPPPQGHDSWEAWARANAIPESEGNSARAVVDPDREGPRIHFHRVTEPKTVKNRVHLDLDVGGGPAVPPDERRARVDREVERLRRVGASLVDTTHADGEYLVTLRDPGGNEFCVL